LQILKEISVLLYNHLRSALFCDFTQPGWAVCYRRFGTTYWAHLQGPVLEDGIDRLYRKVGNKLPVQAA